LAPQCFGQALQFEIRAREHWTIRGSSSSYIKKRNRGEYSEETNSCDYDEDVPSQLRVYSDKTYTNNYLIFKMVYGEKWKDGPQKENPEESDTDTNIEATLDFRIVGGYEEMFRTVGATNITDIEQSPKGELMLVDKGGEGLITFDLMGAFDTVGSHVN
jgi:hypothetical protein